MSVTADASLGEQRLSAGAALRGAYSLATVSGLRLYYVHNWIFSNARNAC